MIYEIKGLLYDVYLEFVKQISVTRSLYGPPEDPKSHLEAAGANLPFLRRAVRPLSFSYNFIVQIELAQIFCTEKSLCTILIMCFCSDEETDHNEDSV